MGKIKRTTGRRNYKRNGRVNVEMDWEMGEKLKELAETQTLYSGQKVTVPDLVRGAIHFTFEQNELLREFFRRRKKRMKTRFRF
jgi:hypothetical protein